MNSYLHWKRVAAAGLLTLVSVSGSALFAQTKPATPPTKQDDVLVLSPFVVQASDDNGYMATSTMSGTRLKTSLNDIAASITVVTKEFLDDIGASNAEGLLPYTVGTEVDGLGGNLTNAAFDGVTSSANFGAERRNPEASTRVRGLATIALARNGVQARYVFNGYNLERIEINRGANAILFGLSSPAGIMNAVSNLAKLNKNGGSAEVAFDSEGSRRATLDYNQVLIKDKLALRFDILNDRKKNEQKPSYADEDRWYMAMALKPFRTTTLRANYEKGRLDEIRPNLGPPTDNLKLWWQSGKISFAQSLQTAGIPTSVINPEFDPANPNFNYTSISGEVYSISRLAIFTRPGDQFYNLYSVFTPESGSQPVDGFQAWGNDRVAPNNDYRRWAPISTSLLERGTGTQLNPLANFRVADQLLDRNIFDYRRHKLDGASSNNGRDFEAYDVTLEQQFCERGDYGVELGFSGGNFDYRQSVQELNPLSNGVYVDVNRQTPDGRVNPNFGRPFTAGSEQKVRELVEWANRRITGYAIFDATRVFKERLGWILGRHQFTGFSTHQQDDGNRLVWWPYAGGATFLDGNNAGGEGSRRLGSVIYLGPSIANVANVSDVRIPGYSGNANQKDSAITGWVLNNNTGGVWQQQTVPVLNGQLDSLQNAVLNRTIVDSYGLVWHGKLMGGNLVPTWGWRNDKVDSYQTTAPQVQPIGFRDASSPAYVISQTPATKQDTNTRSWGTVGHIPQSWTRILGQGTKLSLLYNQSSNFSVNGVRKNVLGELVPPPSGKSKEFGLAVTLLDGKLSARLTRYETSQAYATDGRLNPGWVTTVENAILVNNTAAAIAASGYVGPLSANQTPVLKDYLTTVQYNVGTLNPTTGTYSGPTNFVTGLVGLGSTDSSGYEFEMTANPTKSWTMAFNVSKQKAFRGNVDAAFDSLIQDRFAQWTKPGIGDVLVGTDRGVKLQDYIQSAIVIPYRGVKATENLLVDRNNEWRANIVTTYKFREGRLKGLTAGVGVRYQSGGSIGNRVINDPLLGLIRDVTKPWYAPDQYNTDAWLSYDLPFLKKHVRNWTVGLRVRNLLNQNLLQPVAANPLTVGGSDFVVGQYRIGQRRIFELSSKFQF